MEDAQTEIARPGMRPSRRARRRWLVSAVAITGVLAVGVHSTGASASPSLGGVHDDWPMFMHDALHSGVSPDTLIGASTAGTLAVKWSHPVGGTNGVDASPVVVYNATKGKAIAYEGSQAGIVHAFSAHTGATIWTTQLPGVIAASPTVDGNTVYVGLVMGALYALDATTGAVQCSFTLPVFAPQTKPGRILTSPVVGHLDATGPVVFFGDTGQSEEQNAGHEWAVNGYGNTAGSCKSKWFFNGFTHAGTRTGVWSPSALTMDSTGRPLVLFGTSDPDDSEYALNAETGAKVWTYETTFGHDEDIGAGPTISGPGVNGFGDGVVYVNAKDFTMYALNLLTGQVLWTFNFATDTGLTPNSVSTPALSGENLVVGYATYLYDLDAKTGARLWRTAPSDDNILSSPAISGKVGDQVAFIGNKAGQENGYRLSDGAPVFAFDIGASSIRDSAAVSVGMLYFAGQKGRLYALAPASG